MPSTVAEVFDVHSNFLKLELKLSFIRSLKTTTMHTTHTHMYRLHALSLNFI